MAEEIKKNWIQLASLIIMIAGLVISLSIYVSARPDRSEVKQMIEEKVEFRLKNLEEQMTSLNRKMDQLLLENRK